MKRLLAAVICSLALGGFAQAAIDTYEFSDESDRQRFRELTSELRCPKCQNQNIADSDAPIAMDLRREIFRMLESGQDDEQIVEHLVARYGDFVRYKPPVELRTLLLWYGPWLMLGAGLLSLVVIVVRRRKVENAPQNALLSDEEQKRLSHLLDKKDP